MENKIVSVKNNCPVPRGGFFKEVITYSDGRTKTIQLLGFRGKPSNWNEVISKTDYDK